MHLRRFNWLLAVGAGLAGIAVLIVRYCRFPLSHMAYGSYTINRWHNWHLRENLIIGKDINIRKAEPIDQNQIIGALQDWWGGRDLTAMLPRLFR
jgi:hypothetical protein